MTSKKPATKRDICGEYRGWNTHRRYGEEVCDPCRAAQAKYAKERRHRTGESKSTLYTAAQIEAIKQQAAAEALRKMHSAQLTRRASRIKAGRKRL